MAGWDEFLSGMQDAMNGGPVSPRQDEDGAPQPADNVDQSRKASTSAVDNYSLSTPVVPAARPAANTAGTPNATVASPAAADDSDTSAPPTPYKVNFDAAMDKVRQLQAINPDDKQALYKQYPKTGPDGAIKMNADGTLAHDSILSDIGKGIMLSMKKIAPIMLDRNVSDKTALGYAIGAAIGGGGSNAFMRTNDEKAKLGEDKAEATQNAGVAQTAYTTDTTNRQKQSLMDASGERTAQGWDRLQNTRDKNVDAANNTKLKTMMGAIEKGAIDPSKDPAALDLVRKLSGAPLTFDPQKAKAKFSKVVEDAANNKAYTVTTFDNGEVVSRLMKDENGNAMSVTDPRVKAEQIRATTQVQTTGMRTKSSEEIAAMNNKAKLAVAKLVTDSHATSQASAQIFAEYERLAAADTSGADAVDLLAKATANLKGKGEIAEVNGQLTTVVAPKNTTTPAPNIKKP